MLKNYLNKKTGNNINAGETDKYLGYTRAKDGQVSHNMQRPSRKSKHCLRNKSYCSMVSKEDAEKMFTKF